MRSWLSLDTRTNGECDVYCFVRGNTFYIASDENVDTIFQKIKFSNILNVVMTDKCVFTVVCTKDSNLTFRAKDEKECEDWILALLDDSSNSEHHVSNDSFTVIRELGEGSSGKVVLAKHKETGMLFAIKSISKTNDEKHTLHVLSERNVLIKANNNFIVKLYYAFQTPNRLCLVLEYVEGGDLSKFLDDPDFSFTKEQAKQIICEIALALEHLHNDGIVFRDLKPQNILIKSDGHIKLTDFGLARDIVHDGTTKSICGTMCYVAPEMIRSQDYDFKVDWWALGVITYQLFFKKFPFSCDNEKILFDSILTDSVEIESSDSALVSFILSLLEKDPAKRLCDVFSHPFMHGMKKEDINNMRYDAGFRPLKNIDYEEDSCIIEEEDYEASFIIPNFSFCYDEQNMQ